MDASLYTIEQSRKDQERFARFMNVTTELLVADAKSNMQLYSHQNGEKLELIVLDKMRSLASQFNISPEKIRKSDKQHFPDILLDDTTYGVEVKSVKDKTWLSTGSSIVESLRETEIEKVYLMFGRLSAPDIDFRCKPYEECLSEIAVTHSPRYLINMDMAATEKTIFQKMGTSYDEFRKMGEGQISLVRQYYRDKYRRKSNKSMPWWLEEDTVRITHPRDLFNPCSEIRMLTDLSDEVKEYFRLCSYTLFPEILGTEQDKFRKPTLWLCSRFSIICSNVRDFFTAGGTINMYVNDVLVWKNVPKVIANLSLYLKKIEEYMEDDEEMIMDITNFSSFFHGDQNLFDQWTKAANKFMSLTLAKSKYEKVTGCPLTVEELSKLTFSHSSLGGYYYQYF